MIETASGVLPFRNRNPAPARHPRTVMEAVYAAGSLGIPADDLTTKMVAATLQTLGLLVIEEVQADGTSRPLSKAEARRRMAERPWRLVKPGFGQAAGTPDADGALVS